MRTTLPERVHLGRLPLWLPYRGRMLLCRVRLEALWPSSDMYLAALDPSSPFMAWLGRGIARERQHWTVPEMASIYRQHMPLHQAGVHSRQLS